MLLADPLDEPEPEPDAPADGAVDRPALAGRDRRHHAGRRPDGIRPPLDARVLGEWLVHRRLAVAQPGRPTHSVVVL